jgi:formyltetrahydrofolate deformylase
MNFKLEFSSKKIRTAIFVSKYNHCLYDLVLRNKEGELSTDICMIIGNHRDAESIAEYFSIPFYYFPIDKERKQAVEEEELRLLKENAVDLVILARYMQILSGDFVDAYKDRIINIHHSFLPAFAGARPYHQAHMRGVKIIGASSHYVTENLDEGPIIEQDVVRISHRDTVKDLVRKGRNLEKLVLSKAVKLHLEHRILVFRNKTVVFE